MLPRKPLAGWTSNQNLLSVIISTFVLLLVFAAAWGDLRAQILNIDHRVTSLEMVVQDHNGDTSHHVDAAWKQDVMSRLAEIQRLITAHMAASIPRK
jgi:hypothetical protein